MKTTKSSKLQISRKQQFFVTGGLVALLAGLFGVFALVGNALEKPPVTSFAQCVTANGSTLQESYPEVCATKDGKRFQNPSQFVKSEQ